MLVDYLSNIIGVALHKCLECRVCVVCLNVAFSDDAVACTTEVRIDNLFSYKLDTTGSCRGRNIQTAGGACSSYTHAVDDILHKETSCSQRHNLHTPSPEHKFTITIDALQYLIAIACETPCRRLTCLVMQSKDPLFRKKHGCRLTCYYMQLDFSS